MLPQALARLHPAPGDAGDDASPPECPSLLGGVVRLVGVQLGRTVSWTSRPTARPDDGRDGVHQRLQLREICLVRGGDQDGERDTSAIHGQVVLAAALAPVGGIRPDLVAAPLRVDAEAVHARPRPVDPPSSPIQFKIVACRRSHTPAACQCRSRRQHVDPLPHPTSLGSSRHGVPVRSTNTIPARAARSGTRGWPPLGFGRSPGSSGSIASQRSSDTGGAGITAAQNARPLPGYATRCL